MTEQEWVPAFEGQRPPFQRANTLAVTHGAYSPRITRPEAEALVSSVLERAAQPSSSTSYLLEPSYRPGLWRWATALVRMERLDAAIVGHGDCAGCKKCGRWHEDWRRYASIVATSEQRLGLDPLSRARLGRDVAAAQVDLAALWAAEGTDSAGGGSGAA